MSKHFAEDGMGGGPLIDPGSPENFASAYGRNVDSLLESYGFVMSAVEE